MGVDRVTALVPWVGGAQSTVTGLLAQRLEADPDSEYLDVCGVSVTAASVAEPPAACRLLWPTSGVAPGDRVATLLENSIEAALAWWGIVSAAARSPCPSTPRTRASTCATSWPTRAPAS